jgi:hypothetical protein
METAWRKQFDKAGLACLPEIFCYCITVSGHALLTPRLSCWRPGRGNAFPTHRTGHTWPLRLPRVWQTEKQLQGWRFPSDDIVKTKVQKWFLEQDVSFYRQSLGNLIVCYEKCKIKFGDRTEIKEDDCSKISVCTPFFHLFPLT